MSNLSRGLRQALTVARRDLKAMVMTPTFLLFLLSPLLMIGFGALGSMSASTAMQSGEDKERMVVITPAAHLAAVHQADGELRRLFSRPRPELIVQKPDADPAAQARALFDDGEVDVAAVLYGPLERPRILRAPDGYSEAAFLTALAQQATRAEKAGAVVPAPRPEVEIFSREASTSSGRGQAGYFAVLGIFMLTLMLSGQAVGAMAEERSNKVIEVLAAAVPLESVFFGKLLGTFGSALLFVGFWGTLFANLPKFMPPSFAEAFGSMGTAVGPMFAVLFVIYFAMAYLLLSAVYVGLGAQAGSQREIQMLSLPITIFQFGMLGLGSYAAGHPESWIARVAEIFPFSSPLAMTARAANSPELWPHLVAIGWQGLWLAITVTIAARMFRRGVLKSGSPRRRARRAAA
jgi:ABC-2 type transport system permease protein